MARVCIDFQGGFEWTPSRGLDYRHCLMLMEPMTKDQKSSTGDKDHKTNDPDSKGSPSFNQSLVLFIDLFVSETLRYLNLQLVYVASVEISSSFPWRIMPYYRR